MTADKFTPEAVPVMRHSASLAEAQERLKDPDYKASVARRLKKEGMEIDDEGKLKIVDIPKILQTLNNIPPPLSLEGINARLANWPTALLRSDALVPADLATISKKGGWIWLQALDQRLGGEVATAIVRGWLAKEPRARARWIKTETWLQAQRPKEAGADRPPLPKALGITVIQGFWPAATTEWAHTRLAHWVDDLDQGESKWVIFLDRHPARNVFLPEDLDLEGMQRTLESRCKKYRL